MSTANVNPDLIAATYTLLSDVTPNRATVEMVGSEADCSDRNIYDNGAAGWTMARVCTGVEVEVGQRAWIQDAGRGRVIVTGQPPPRPGRRSWYRPAREDEDGDRDGEVYVSRASVTISIPLPGGGETEIEILL